MSTPLLLAATVLAAYRITRLLAVDVIFDRQRQWLARRAGRIEQKLSYLFSCPFCVSVYLSGWLVLALDLYGVSLPLPLLWWASVAGGASLLAALDGYLTN